MPITIVVRSASGGESPSLTFDGPRVVLGRSDGSDVRLPDPSVSLRHASIRAQGADFVIVDEGSTNGTWVGGIKLGPHTPRLVKTGDLVRLGRVWLEIAIGQRAPTPDLGLATRELALALVRSAMDAVGDDTVVKIRVAEGPDIGAELRLVDEGRIYVIGRAEKCDLPLADEDASRGHAAVVRRSTQVLLRDLGSRNGVYLGDCRLTPDRDVVWRPPTMARIGLSVLALEEPVSLALAELEAAADEVVPDAAAPPPPPPSIPASSGLPAGSVPPESRMAPAQQAPIAEVASRTATTVAQPKRRVWTAADVMVVTIAVSVIAASVAGLVWVLR
ncbi:MAG TPA: FHA domain-containing protein [Labilithrix sp.]|nr:FHA domain-containing protein [Labilithrix sp.]